MTPRKLSKRFQDDLKLLNPKHQVFNIYISSEKNRAVFMDNKELFYSLVLKHTPGIGPRTWKKLIEVFKSAQNAVANSHMWNSIGISSSVVNALNKKTWRKKVSKEIELIKKSKSKYLLLSDPEYPTQLFEIPDPPIIIYYEGNLSLLKNPCIAIVGARKIDTLSQKLTLSIATNLSKKGITIVSGLAVGVDTIAHRGGLKHKGSTIAVLGTGIDVNYPAPNVYLKETIKKSGLVISEFPSSTPPASENFPIRNRIISGISLGVLVVQAAKKSGSLITASCALEQNRMVFSIPGPIDNPAFEGNNELIKNGAILITNAEDILSEIKYQVDQSTWSQDKNHEEKPTHQQDHGILNNLSKKILDFIKNKGEAGIEQMCDDLDIGPSELTSQLIQLEVEGKVKRDMTNKYYIPN